MLCRWRIIRILIEEYADIAARSSVRSLYGCAVFLDSDRVIFKRKVFLKRNSLPGWRLCAENIW